jgi:hypothetical protein
VSGKIVKLGIVLERVVKLEIVMVTDANPVSVSIHYVHMKHAHKPIKDAKTVMLKE